MKKIYLPALVTAVILVTSCNSLGAERDPSIRETQIELNVRQTIASQRETTPNPDSSTPATGAITQTPVPVIPEIASPSVQTPVDGTIEPVVTQPPGPGDETNIPPTESAAGFEEWMKTANILLYEDMISNPNTTRYVKDTLNEMGIECSQSGDLPCRDVGSAQGWFRNAIETGPANGKPWDLVIVASEHKGGVNELKSSLPTDYYGIIIGLIDQGIPVILEVGDLDRSFTTNAKDLLDRCGITHQSNWVRIPPSRMVMFPLAVDHPILNEPNSDLSFSSVTTIWTTDVRRQYYDIGDLVALAPGSSATLLVGTTADLKDSYGTLTTCMDGMLLLQTFSSHQLTYSSMKFVWENYIYNQLRQRFIRQ